MKLLRLAGAGLLWTLACLLGLVGALLCATVILLPIGLLLIAVARRFFRLSGRLALPRAVRHPVAEMGNTGKQAIKNTGRSARKQARDSAKKITPQRKRGVFGLRT